MILRINQVPVEFTLESERTFADLTASLRAWAAAQDQVVAGILADGKALGPDDQTPLDALGELEVETVAADESDLARIDVVERYFSLVAQGCQNRDAALLSELHKEFGAMRPALFPLLSAVATRLGPALAVFDSPWSDPASLETAARQMAREAGSLQRERRQPLAALAETLDNLETSLAAADAVAGLFQKGLDRDGLDLILRLFTDFEDLARRAALAGQSTGSDLTGWVEFNAELQPLLGDAGEALGSGDFILLTDLLEYEIAPRLRSARSLFPEAANLDRVGPVL